MIWHRWLPWDYGVRNLLRRPVRTALTLAAMVIVVFLVLVVVGFIRGLERSLAISGDPEAVLVHALTAGENLETSAIPAQTPALLAASLTGIRRWGNQPAISPELFLGTRIQTGGAVEGMGGLIKSEPEALAENADSNIDSRPRNSASASGSQEFAVLSAQGMGLVRGVTGAAPLVRRGLRLVEGRWPDAGEVLVGRLTATKLGCEESQLDVGQTIRFEQREWKIAGRFAAGEAAFEAEIWCRLEDFQAALKRQDLSLVALLADSPGSAAEVELFCKQRTDLELVAVSEAAYYASLQKFYRPIRMLAWVVVALVSGAGMFAGMNLMYGAVAGRVREIATLRAIGFRRRAILLGLLQEGLLLAALGTLIAGAIALYVLNGSSIRFTMGAFAMRLDGPAMLAGCGAGLTLGLLGTLPPAVRALRMPVVTGLKSA